MQRSCFLLAISVLGIFTLMAQQQNQRKTLTLDKALSTALDRNVDVAQSAYDIDNANASVLSAYGSYIPRLSASAGYSRSGFSSPPSLRTIGGIPFDVPRTETFYNTFNGSVGLSYIVFDGFSRESNFSSAQTNALIAEQSYDRTRQAIANSAISFYLNVLRNEQQVRVFLENLNNEKKRLDRITEQNRLGSVAIGDVYRQQSAVAQAEFNLISGQNTYDKSKADLLNLLALEVSEDYSIADPSVESEVKQLDNGSEDALGSYEDLVRRALEARPDYANVKARVYLADQGITQAWSFYYPSVSLSGGYSTNAQDWTKATSWNNHSTSLGLNVSWQLPELFGSTQRIQSANISKRKSELELDRTTRNIKVEIKKALLDLEASRKQYMASQRSQVAAEQDKKVAEARYDVGSGTLLDLQFANTAYLNAQLTTLSTAFSYYTLKKNLELVIGEKKY